MSILKRVPNDIRQLRDFLTHERELQNKYYYLVHDFETDDHYYHKNETFRDDETGMFMGLRNYPEREPYVRKELDEGKLFGNLEPLGLFDIWTIDPKHSYYFEFYDPYYKRRTRSGLKTGLKNVISAKYLKDVGIHHLVYTELPPAAGSVPLTYNDYIESMRVNDLDGGRKKTRNCKNRKSKKTQKYKKRRGKR